VFTRPDGTPLHPHAFSDTFKLHVRDAKLPKIRLHDIRHTYASAALAASIPAKVVSERLGHANIAITMDTYSHVLPGLDEHAAITVADLILNGPPAKSTTEPASADAPDPASDTSIDKTQPVAEMAASAFRRPCRLGCSLG
jgi:hypothetical protein